MKFLVLVLMLFLVNTSFAKSEETKKRSPSNLDEKCVRNIYNKVFEKFEAEKRHVGQPGLISETEMDPLALSHLATYTMRLSDINANLLIVVSRKECKVLGIHEDKK